MRDPLKLLYDLQFGLARASGDGVARVRHGGCSPAVVCRKPRGEP
jgi:hypothetical protein